MATAQSALSPRCIELLGSTNLLRVGNNYYLESISCGTGPELQSGGAAVTAGGSWVPIAAEQTAAGYDVAWKISGANEYTVWSTDSSGNFIANITGAVSGNSIALESLETTFHQDLNGDGTIGLVGTVIESSGSTSLVEVGNNYYLDSISSGTGPELKYAGAAVTAGEFGTLDADRRGTDRAAATMSPGRSRAPVSTRCGAPTATAITSPTSSAPVSGNSTALESLETTFHQDLNGDGTIGIPTDGDPDRSDRPAWSQVGNNYYLNSISSGTGPELKYRRRAVTAGQFGSWTPIGAEQIAGGYDVAWKNSGTGQYTVWSTDSNGNYIANITGAVSGNSTALESLETTFHQDLNGDGTIGLADDGDRDRRLDQPGRGRQQLLSR